MATKADFLRFDWASPNISKSFEVFRQQCDLYVNVKGTKKEKQVSHILLSLGEKGLRMYNSWSMPEDDKKDPSKVWDKF